MTRSLYTLTLALSIVALSVSFSGESKARDIRKCLNMCFHDLLQNHHPRLSHMQLNTAVGRLRQCGKEDDACLGSAFEDAGLRRGTGRMSAALQDVGTCYASCD